MRDGIEERPGVPVSGSPTALGMRHEESGAASRRMDAGLACHSDRVATWPPDLPGLVRLPSGRRVRGRSLRRAAEPAPGWGLYLFGRAPAPTPWPARWVRWRDFWVPSDPADARAALVEAWERSADRRVEVACGGGVGRTGTALAALAVLDGMAPDRAVAFVRSAYHPRAVETPWQRAWLRHLAAADSIL